MPLVRLEGHALEYYKSKIKPANNDSTRIVERVLCDLALDTLQARRSELLSPMAATVMLHTLKLQGTTDAETILSRSLEHVLNTQAPLHLVRVDVRPSKGKVVSLRLMYYVESAGTPSTTTAYVITMRVSSGS